MSDPNNPMATSEQAAERALREGLRANALSPEALQRIRRVTLDEWRATTAQPARPRIRSWMPLAAAASVLMLAGIGWLAFIANPAPNAGAVLGELARFDAPGMVETRLLRKDVSIMAGAKLRAGQTLEVRGDSLVTLAGGGNLRIARESAIEVASATVVTLERGELYVDIPPGSRANPSFVVRTPAGEFRHAGTQFAVALVKGLTRLRVREGSVHWLGSEGESTVAAGTEVLVDANHTVTRRTIATAGRDWTWAESMAPEIDIENRPVREFLEWFARETGRKLVLADDVAREQVATVRTHGNVRGLTATEALSAVMASTTLRFELPEGAIRVSSVRETAAASN